jgi:TRAP transporter 4TM/12TM fusion protein
MTLDTAEAKELVEKFEGRYRSYKGTIGKVVKGFTMTLPIFALAWHFRLWEPLGITIFAQQYIALFLAWSMVLVFLLAPAGKGASKAGLPWYDMLLIAASLASTLYIFFVYQSAIYMGVGSATVLEQLLGLILMLTLSEALRRTFGLAMVVVVWFFFFYAKFGYLIPTLVQIPEFSLQRVMGYFYMSEASMFGNILVIAATYIILFVTFGYLFERTGAGRFVMNLSLSLLGTVRGGPAQVAVLSSALFGTISGSTVANIVVTGSVTIPLMKKIGYQPHYAGAVEAVASSGGGLVPPVMGALAFVMADFTHISYWEICLAAIVPSILYYLCLSAQLFFQAGKRGMKGLPRHELPSLKKTIKEGWQFSLPIIMLVTLLALKFSALTSVIYTMGCLIAVSWFRKDTRLGIKGILGAFEDAAKGSMAVTVICGLAGIITASVAMTGLGINMTTVLTTIASGNLLILTILAGLACYVMGMGIAHIAAYIILAVTIVPAMMSLGTPLLAAHFFIFYMGLSTFFTPPFCTAAYVASSLADAPPFKIGFQAMRLGIVTYIAPFTFIFYPALLLIGNPIEILTASVTAIVAMLVLAAALEGFFLKGLNWLERIALILAALGLLIPDVTVKLVAIVLLLPIVLRQIIWLRASHRATQPNG